MPLFGTVVRISVIILFVELVEKTYSQSGVTNNDLGPLYDALVKTLAYLGHQHQSLDTDALLGLRIAEGYIHRIVEECEQGMIKTNVKVFNNLKDLQNRVAEAMKKVLPLVKENDPAFYPVLDSQWNYYKPYKFLLLDDVSQNEDNKPIDTSQYLHCVDDVVGSKYTESETCTISGECWTLMTDSVAPRQLLYYQALFFILGEASGCLERFTSQTWPSGMKLEKHLNNICSLSYYSVAWSSFRGGGDPQDLILVLKHSFTCGVLGFHQLLTDQGLSNAIGWQLLSGCYGDYTRVGEQKKIDNQGKRELKSTYLGGGCFSDVTGVGVGLLAVYLRWVLDPPPQVLPVHLVKSAEEGARTLSVYMLCLLLLTAGFLFLTGRTILKMASYFWNFCRSRG